MKGFALTTQAEFLVDNFSTIEDPRIDRHKLHALIDILFLAIFARLSGMDGWEEIEEFGESKLAWLRSWLPFANGIPSHDTISRVLRMLCPEEVQRRFTAWIQSAISLAQGSIIAIDGKSARRSYTKKELKNPLHMVSAWCCTHGVVPGQEKVSDKSNEITAIPALLELIKPAGAIITIDAMGCQKEITTHIVAHNADYILALKDNQKTLAEEVKAWFHKAEREQFGEVEYSLSEQADAGHGRVENAAVHNWL